MKIAEVFVIVLLICGMGVTCAAAQNYTGTWKCVEYSRGGEDVPEMAEQGSLQLDENGLYHQTLSADVTEAGYYRIDGTAIQLWKHSKVKMSGEIQNDTMTLEFRPLLTKIVYKKAK